MVEITLTPHRERNSSRAFPYTGVLGLTPVSVQGVVRVKLDEDRRPVQDAFSVSVRVRCYEADNAIGASSSRAHLLYEVAETVWTPPDGQAKASLSELERPFRLVVPRDAPSHGALSMLSFKTFRVFWMVDAGASTSRPAPLTLQSFTTARRASTAAASVKPTHYSSSTTARPDRRRRLQCGARRRQRRSTTPSQRPRRCSGQAIRCRWTCDGAAGMMTGRRRSARS